ncbi:hypothetical protein HU230_0008880 [Bradyrhizobium quebecense]|uniref:Uncharacterized protein n=1 Tax=Bradyrhizobium quebecense TaxID=2748629 RepID=A0A973WSJ1_9BRAD|nr:hypothetical protein [Bradyrhizobium quebecense]UGA46131.1 hypothetical protein HU230_0008880 [Bradyrhizobium quebecense]
MSKYVVRHGRRIAVETLKPVQPGGGLSAERFVKLTWAQVKLLHRATRFATTGKVFHLLLFRSFKAYAKPFALAADAFSSNGISRPSQWRAIRELERLRLISTEPGKAKRALVISISAAIQTEALDPASASKRKH